jgi:hypothetical protein
MTHTHTTANERKIQGRRRTKQSTSATPAEFLIQLHHEYPNEDRDRLMGKFIDECVSRNLFHAEFTESWYRLHYNTLVTPPRRMTAEEKKEQKEQRDRRVSETVVRAKAIIIKQYTLSTIMPNNKPLRECTGAEITLWRDQLGHLADMVGPKQTVGEVFKTDTEIAKA